MPRLFVGIAIPDNIAETLLRLQSGVRGARWRPKENFHITLRFIGDVQDILVTDIDHALSDIEHAACDIRLKSTGEFGHKKPRAIWTGVEDEGTLSRLARKTDTALQRIGFEPEGRKYVPHVTLAYLKHTRTDHVQTYLQSTAHFQSDAFHIDHFVLYESHLGNHASHYVTRAEYPLMPQPWVEER